MTKTRSDATDMTYPADMVWACAAHADRVNGGYRKTSGVSYDTNSDQIVEQTSNKHLMLRLLHQWHKNTLHKDVVTEADYQAGQSAREFWQNQMLLLLDDRSNEYQRVCTKAAHEESITSLLTLATIASAITAANRERRKAAVIDKKRSVHSEHVCAIKNNVVFDTEFEVIDCRHINRIGANSVEAIANGNLYQWWSNPYVEPGIYQYLKGRVKAHIEDFHTGQPVTQLNYVKVHK